MYYNKSNLLKGNTGERRNSIMTGYAFVLLLLQKIDELQKELQKYKDNESKN